MKTIEQFLRGVLCSLQLEYSELEESCPEILEDVKEQTESFIRKAIEEDRINIAEHAEIDRKPTGGGESS